MSHVKTKQDLTIYLAQKFMKEFTKRGARYSVTDDLQSQSNIDNYSPELLEHDHEEAHTLLIVKPLMLQEMILLVNVEFIHRIQMS